MTNLKPWSYGVALVAGYALCWAITGVELKEARRMAATAVTAAQQQANQEMQQLLMKMQPRVTDPAVAVPSPFPGMEYEVAPGETRYIWAPLGQTKVFYAKLVTLPLGGCIVQVADFSKLERLPEFQSSPPGK